MLLRARHCSTDPFALGFIASLTAETVAGRVCWSKTGHLLTTISPDRSVVQFATTRNAYYIQLWRLFSIRNPQGDKVFRAITHPDLCPNFISAIDALLAASRLPSLN
jgi:hypothetical protein